MNQRAPIRIVHLGLGAFHRAHQAWYTERANQLDDHEQYGIWAFTGRRPNAAISLSAQDFRYTLIERSATGDTATKINSIVRASDGADRNAWLEALSSPEVIALTVTITEKGYRVAEDDHEKLIVEKPCESSIGRIVDGLRARRAASAGDLVIMSCDNLPDNGSITAHAVRSLAGAVDPELEAWIDDHVSFPSSMVDRITPGTTPADLSVAAELAGWRDEMPVITEPFSEWVIALRQAQGTDAGEAQGADEAQGAGLWAAWERVGVRFVTDIAPYEQRKLWLLNAGHSLLAYVGLSRGHETVDEAMADPYCADLLEQLWRETRECLPFDDDELDQATSALRARFSNPRMRDQLRRIAADGSVKLPLRILDVYRARKNRGLPTPTAGPAVVAAWITHLGTDLVSDPIGAKLKAELVGLPDPQARARVILNQLAPDLADDDQLITAISASK